MVEIKRRKAMNYRKAIEKRIGDESYSSFADRANINASGFYQSMGKDNPDFGWKQLLKISQALKVKFNTLAKEALEQA
jgi:hypothetical protein